MPLRQSLKDRFKPQARMLARGLQRSPLPSTIIGSAKHIVEDTKSWAQKQSQQGLPVTYQLIEKAFEEPFEAPTHPVQHARLDKVVKSQPERFILQLPNYLGRIYGPGCVISPDDSIFRNASGIREGLEKAHPALTRLRYPVCKKISGTVAPISFGSPNNYYHWLFEILPRIHLLQQAGKMGEIDFFVLPQEHPFQIETIRLLDIQTKKIIQPGKHLHIRPQKMMVPSLPGNAEAPPRWVCQWLRQSFLPDKAPPSPKRRLFIDRGSVSRRKLLNQHALLKLLESHGFESIDPGKLSFAAQIQTFSEADIIIGVHGAALANLVFCSPHTNVIELFSPWYVNPVYRFICAHVGLRYTPLLGLGVRPASDHLSNSVKADIDPDLIAIQNLLHAP